MPVRHDSDEWIQLNKTVSRIDSDLRSLADRQASQHSDNVKRMDRIEATQQELANDVAEIKEVMSEVKGVLIAVKTAANILKWLLGIILALQTLYMLFGPTIRKSLELPNAKVTEPGAQGKVTDPSKFNARE
jgi:uncharacterized protein (UPF0335 family)